MLMGHFTEMLYSGKSEVHLVKGITAICNIHFLSTKTNLRLKYNNNQGLLKTPIKTEAVLRYGAPPPLAGQAAP